MWMYISNCQKENKKCQTGRQRLKGKKTRLSWFNVRLHYCPRFLVFITISTNSCDNKIHGFMYRNIFGINLSITNNLAGFHSVTGNISWISVKYCYCTVSVGKPISFVIYISVDTELVLVTLSAVNSTSSPIHLVWSSYTRQAFWWFLKSYELFLDTRKAVRSLLSEDKIVPHVAFTSRRALTSLYNHAVCLFRERRCQKMRVDLKALNLQ